ncbi:MAG TPA: lipoate--protein ligase family protein [Anaerolineaceae bacterium]|nr:lipoate--protein ligase family protein [Anaerolineaceae bacterium]
MEISPNRWRLIYSPPASGAWNMAVDEAIVESMRPTLRLYAWQPACLSLGYAQPVQDVDRDALTANGWDLIRRPTGGRAILHADELTYAVAGPADDPHFRGTLLESYQRFALALELALTRLGLTVSMNNQAVSPAVSGPICFETPSNYEITYEGKKIVGSAQSRRFGGILQHGSIPLTGDLTRITRVLAYANQALREAAAENISRKAVTIEAALGKPVDWQTAAEYLFKAFADSLGIQFSEEGLTSAETERAQFLVTQKYACSDWTERV